MSFEVTLASFSIAHDFGGVGTKMTSGSRSGFCPLLCHRRSGQPQPLNISVAAATDRIPFRISIALSFAVGKSYTSIPHFPLDAADDRVQLVDEQPPPASR